MKSKHLTLGIIFLFGWLAGSLFTYFYLQSYHEKQTNHDFTILKSSTKHLSNHPQRQNSSQLQLQHQASINNNNINSKTLLLPIGKLKNQLPSYSFNQVNITFHEYQILLDWPLDDKLFTYENYLALESLLITYPHAQFRILLPISRDVIQFKIGNLLSIHQFTKYKKLGYDVQVVAIDQMIQSRGPGFGTSYWDRWSKTCCQSCDADCRSNKDHHLQPFHLLMYIRLCRLWRRGGISTDFSFIFLAPLMSPKIKQGYYLQLVCSDSDNLELWQNEQGDEPQHDNVIFHTKESNHLKSKSNRCFPSTLLVFNKAKSEVVDCILRSYDNVTFVSCIEEDDSEKEGFSCIREVFEMCFSHLGIQNDLTTQTFERTKTDEIILETFPSVPSNECLFLFLFSPSPSPSLLVPSYLTSSTVDWEVTSSSKVISLGTLAKEGHWRMFNTDLTKSSLLSTISDQISQRLRINFDISKRRRDCSLQCHLYSTTPFSFREEISSSSTSSSASLSSLESESKSDLTSYHTGMESSSCAPSIIIAGFAQSAVSIVYSLLLLHPQVLPPLGSSLIPDDPSHYRPSCYRTDLPVRNSILFRSWCYPFISPLSIDQISILNNRPPTPRERQQYTSDFISIDKDIRYVIDMEAPLVMKADNPNMKVIFVLRHPIERLIAHFQELLNYFPTLNLEKLLDISFERRGKFGRMYQVFLNQTYEQDQLLSLISDYYTPMDPLFPETTNQSSPMRHVYQLADRIFMQSMYLIPILHYGQIMGRHNLMIVSMDTFNSTIQMTSRKLEKISQTIYSFSGLCSHSIDSKYLNDISLHGGVNSKISIQVEMETVKKLFEFFEPFNRHLSQLIGIDLNHWNSMDEFQRSNKDLMLFSNSSKYSKRYWFESQYQVEENQTTTAQTHPPELDLVSSVLSTARKSILKALFPERVTPESGDGFNTTIGMLAMF